MAGLAGIAEALKGLLARKEPEPEVVVAAPSAEEIQAERLRYAAKCLLLGLEACQRDDARRAFDTFHEAFIAYLQAGDRKAASLMQKTIGLVIQKIDSPTKVRAALKHAYRMLQQAGLRDEEARSLFLLADFEASQAAYKDAYALYEDSLRLAKSIDYKAGEVECLCRYAWTLRGHGKIQEAQRRLVEARQIAKDAMDDALMALVMRWAQRFADNKAVSMKDVKKTVEKDPLAGVKKAW
jgi:tetratricopeptide (TPR) repeat protein